MFRRHHERQSQSQATEALAMRPRSESITVSDAARGETSPSAHSAKRHRPQRCGTTHVLLLKFLCQLERLHQTFTAASVRTTTLATKAERFQLFGDLIPQAHEKTACM